MIKHTCTINIGSIQIRNIEIRKVKSHIPALVGGGPILSTDGIELPSDVPSVRVQLCTLKRCCYCNKGYILLLQLDISVVDV